jgi:hypothetical protein
MKIVSHNIHFEVVIRNLIKEIIRSNYVNFNEFMCSFESENDENHK